jgi:hypothetical protein
MTSNISVVDSGRLEPYLFSSTGGVCAGLIDSVYIPPSSSVYYNGQYFFGSSNDTKNSNFDEPDYFQRIVERQLSALFMSIPPWLSSRCFSAMRKYFCTSMFLKPQWFSVQEILASNSFEAYRQVFRYSNSSTFSSTAYPKFWIKINQSSLSSRNKYSNSHVVLPSYPHESICLDYEQECRSFINTWAGKLFNKDDTFFPRLWQPDCSRNVTLNGYYSNGTSSSMSSVRAYPSKNQTVSRLLWQNTTTTIYLSGKKKLRRKTYSYVVVDVQTEPFSLLQQSSGGSSTSHTYNRSSFDRWQTTCPTGYVVPDNAFSDRITWMEGTGCATACR